MVLVLAAWIVVGLVFTGLGLGFTRLARIRAAKGEWLTTAFWLGFCLAIVFLQLWHFALPVSWRATTTVTLCGAVGLAFARKDLVDAVASFRLREHGPLGAVLVLCTLWVADHATAAGVNWDYGVYHLPAVRWTHAYPIVPGLGNLHGRLAFNSSYHLYAAMLEVGPLAGRSNHVANGLLAAAFLNQIVVALFRFVRRRAAPPWGLELALLAPALFLVLRSGDLASTVTDVPVALVLFVGAARVFTFFGTSNRDPRTDTLGVLVVVLLLMTAVTIKLTALAFSLGAAALIIAVWVARHGWHIVLQRPVAAGLVVAALSGGSWVTRSIILSGYPAYPSGAFPAAVDWRVPVEQTRAESAWTRHAGRWYYNPPNLRRGWYKTNDGRWIYDPDALELGWSWVPGWISNAWRMHEHREGIVFPAVIALAGLAFAALGRDPRARSGPGWWLLAPAFAAIVAWIVSAPSPRYGLCLLWIAASAILVQTARHLGERQTARRILIGLVAIGLAPLGSRVAGSAFSKDDSPMRTLSAILVPNPGGTLLPSPTAPLTTFTTDSGLTLYAPVRDQRCWEAPLLCTPQPAPNVALRNPQDLRFGFRSTDGEWKPLNFPDPRAYRSRNRDRAAGAAARAR